ncbi:polyprenol monophosphomannose synthase [Actinoallomurus rhizosphaericola]|uniref:polyprenol monophosphomannose synthase n=1 Tax=Actinoallomurus rhizosphaericola TaxID=2952536 RepID=UPI0020939167|nr:polyprenol monophosphomannose synthase [Actinoallomurus rhizosphaericola]MCO5997062.1 polyprenol monophosphomannose synthase [Actinoallomurus rhizosphaericola]
MQNTDDIGRVLVIIPTYNERENIESIVARVRTAVPEAEILVADDNSPDGTGKIADGLAADDERVHVMHRAGKEGLGAAYIAGFHWGMEHGFDVLVEMDADGSHQPEELARLLSALSRADLVIGSRWVRGGTVENWPVNREILSRGANVYARLMLGIPVRDSTGGYRAYRATTLQKIDIDGVASQGYCFQVDLTLRTVRAGLRVAEVPIRFVERTHGASKMSRAIMIEAFQRIARWGAAYWLGRLTGRERR